MTILKAKQLQIKSHRIHARMQTQSHTLTLTNKHAHKHIHKADTRILKCASCVSVRACVYVCVLVCAFALTCLRAHDDHRYAFVLIPKMDSLLCTPSGTKNSFNLMPRTIEVHIVRVCVCACSCAHSHLHVRVHMRIIDRRSLAPTKLCLLLSVTRSKQTTST